MSSAKNEQPLLISFWRNLLASPVTPKLAAAIASFLLIFSITANHLAHPSVPTLKEGDVARKDYIATESATYIDTEATTIAKDASAADVLPVYSIDIVKNNGILANIKNFFDRTEEIARDLEQLEILAAMPPVEIIDDSDEDGAAAEPVIVTPEIDVEAFENEAVHELSGILNDSVNIPLYLVDLVTEDDLSALLRLDNDTRESIRTIIDESTRIRIADRIEEDEIPEELDTLRHAILEDASENLLTPEAGRLAAQISSYFLRSNSALDLSATQAARVLARENTDPVLGQVSRGQTFLRQGDVVNRHHLYILSALNLTSETENTPPWISIIFFALMLIVVFILGAGFFTSRGLQMMKDARYYLLFHTIVIIAYLTSFFLIQSFRGTSGQENAVLIMLASLPVIGAAILLTHYFTRILAITVSAFLAILVSLAAGNSSILIPALLPSIAAGIIVSRDCPKVNVIRAMFIIPVIWAISLFAELFISGMNPAEIAVYKWYLLLGLTAPPLAMALANYVLDGAFNIPTASRLAEFDNQDHPLLKKLQLEAPGTWHHSMMVGLIAEAACQAIGGNSHLVRVSCMYHDIGKSKRPEFFIENQHGGANLHDKYSPWLSKIIVESHVKDGVTMAKSHGLPQELIDMIPQHHGTSLITYFFRKALAMSEDGFVNEYDYRYPGPKPQTPEAACINLADAAESAARSLDEPTPHRIESLVNKIYEDRLLDGQYDECSLALNQLETIKDTIIDRLVGAYHARIVYPEEEELRRQLQLKRAEGEKTPANGAAAISQDE